MWHQSLIQLCSQKRGVHLVTPEVIKALPELKNFKLGVCHLFLQHTSASLALNENADPDVRHDLEAFLNHSVPENTAYFRHTSEGADDMPAHIKSILVGPALSIPIAKGCLGLGTWQGIYLCEHRNRGGSRRMLATLWGERDAKNF